MYLCSLCFYKNYFGGSSYIKYYFDVTVPLLNHGFMLSLKPRYCGRNMSFPEGIWMLSRLPAAVDLSQKTALFFLCNKPSRLKYDDFEFSGVVVQFFGRRPIGFRRLLPAGSLQKTVR
jgi:hypothetical protein